MTGALEYKEMLVQDVMTPLKNTFMIDSSEKLNFETIAKLFKAGYSRIPVYEDNPVRIRSGPKRQRNTTCELPAVIGRLHPGAFTAQMTRQNNFVPSYST
jgi:hypothetical protein